MTLSLSPALDAARVKLQKRPDFSVQFEGVPYVFGGTGTSSLGPLLFGDGPKFGDIDPLDGLVYTFGDTIESSASLVKTLKVPTGFGSSVQPEQGASSLSGVTIPILVSAELLDTVSNYVLKGKRATIKAGFRDVDPAEWTTVQTNIVDDRDQWPDGLGYDISTSSPDRLEKRQVFAVLSTAINGGTAVTASSTSAITVASTTGFPTSGHIKLENEVIKYTSTTATTFAGTITRAQLGTVAAAHGDKSSVTEVFLLGHTHQVPYTGHPVDIALQVLVSTGGTTLSVYDKLPARHGLGIDPDFIDFAAFAAVKTELTGVAYEFWIDKSVDAKQWLEQEIYKPNGMYQVIKGDGRISLKLFEPPEPDDDLVELTDDNIVGLPRIAGNFQRQYNQLIWRFDWSLDGDKFLGSRVEDNTESQAKYGKLYTMPIEARGLRTKFSDGTAGNAAAIATARSGRLFTRYAEPPASVSFDGLYSTFHIEPGDLVTFVSSFALDHKKGRRGFGTYVLEIVSKSMNFAKGIMSFEALYTPFAGARYGQWGRVGDPDYLSATQGDRDTYVFIGSSAVNPDGEMSNGDDPYRYQ